MSSPSAILVVYGAVPYFIPHGITNLRFSSLVLGFGSELLMFTIFLDCLRP